MATAIRLDQATESRLGRLAQQTGRTKVYYLLEIIRNGIDELEDYYPAAATAEPFREGLESTVTIDDVKLGLEVED